MTDLIDAPQKRKVSEEEFEKRVEIEMANLMYFEHLKKEKAQEQARQYIKTKFTVA